MTRCLTLFSALLLSGSAFAATGARPILVVQSEGEIHTPTWSADGQFLSYTQSVGTANHRVWMVSVDANGAGEPAEIGLPGGVAAIESFTEHSTWHPDGLVLFQGAHLGQQSRLWFSEPGSGAAIEFLPRGRVPGEIVSHALTPGGDALVMLADEGGISRMFIWYPQYDWVRELSGGVGSRAAVAIRSDQQRLAFEIESAAGDWDVMEVALTPLEFPPDLAAEVIASEALKETYAALEGEPKKKERKRLQKLAQSIVIPKVLARERHHVESLAAVGLGVEEGDQLRPIYAGDNLLYLSSGQTPGSYDLCRSRNGEGTVPLASGLPLATQDAVAVSPDGEHLAWTRVDRDVLVFGNADGARTQLSTGLEQLRDPAFGYLGDRTFVAFVARPIGVGADSLYMLDVTDALP